MTKYDWQKKGGKSALQKIYVDSEPISYKKCQQKFKKKFSITFLTIAG